MVKKICNRCGRIYEDICPCRKNIKKKYEYIPGDFYKTKRWMALSKEVKIRDIYSDRLAMYLIRSKTIQNANEDADVYKMLREYLIDVYGNVRYLNGRLLVHHIVPKLEDETKEFVADNLITLNFYTHEYIHQLYKSKHKDAVQTILHNAVMAKLP